MKKYLKEIIISLMQLFVFYLLPIITINIGALGMVFVILITTFILSMVIGVVTNNKFKYFYPTLVSILFIATIWIYYNESAFIHSLWYFVISSIGLIIGISLNKIM